MYDDRYKSLSVGDTGIMKQKIIELIDKFMWMGHINIQRRVFRLILAGGIITFVLLSVLAICSMLIVRENVNSRADKIDDVAAKYMEEFATQEAKIRLKHISEAQAQRIENELAAIGEDVRYLSSMMTSILHTPHNYRAKTLPDSHKQTVTSGQVYLHIGDDCRTETENAAVQREIALAANIMNTLNVLGDKYTKFVSSCQVGSKNGYMIVVDELGHGDGETVRIPPDLMQHFDPRLRPWYIDGKDATDPVFTDVYIGANGLPEFTCAMPYEDRDGFAGVASISTGLQSASQIVAQTTAGNNGFSFVLNQNGEVVMSARQTGLLSVSSAYNHSDDDYKGNDLRLTAEKTMAAAAEKMTSGESGVTLVTIDGEEYYLAFAPMASLGWSFGTLMNVNEIKDPAKVVGYGILQQMRSFGHVVDDTFRDMSSLAAVISLLLTAALIWLSTELANRFVRPIYELSAGVRKIDGENLNKKLEIHTGDEIEHLAICFNAMTDELKKYMEHLAQVTADKERLATEINVAARIQNSVLPKNFPRRPDMELCATMKPAKSVGGDFYDFAVLDNDRLLVTIADVSGKGVSAALFMMIAKTVLNNYAESLQNMDDIVGLLDCTNAHLCSANEAMMFVTACVGILDLRTGRFVYVNCGHNPPLIYRAAEQKFSYLTPKKNFPLGLTDNKLYAKDELHLKQGDILFFYTDGVTEALNERQEMYSEDRLLSTLNAINAASKSLNDAVGNLKASLAAFVGNAAQSDDITMLCLRYRGTDATESDETI